MMKHPICLLLATASLALAAPVDPAEVARVTGMKPMSDADFLAIQEVRMIRRFTDLSGKPDVNLPAAVDLAPDFPPVGRQADPTCPGWTFAYAIKSFHEKAEHGWAYGPNHLFAPTFLTNLLDKGGEANGLRDRDALFVSIDLGAVPLSLYPYLPDDETPPAPELRRLARAFRNLTFRRLPAGDLHSLKAILAGGDPVACAIDVYDEFWNLDKRHPVMRKKPAGPVLSAHYLVIVGYDDKRHAIKFFNSWGKAWGEDGCGWLDYDLYGEIVSHAVVVYDRPTPPEVVAWLADPSRKPVGPPPAFTMAEPDLRKAIRPDDTTETLLRMVDQVSAYEPPKDLSAPDWKVAPADEPLLVVPEEAGVVVGRNWLRLGDPLERATPFFSEKVSPAFAGFKKLGDDAIVTYSFMDATAVGRIDLVSASRLRVLTNRGATIGDPRDKVRRLYRTPDFVANGGALEAYFFQPVASDWGGVKAVLAVALEFHYGPDGRVRTISLFAAYPAAYTNTSLKPIDMKEVKKQAAGETGDTIDSPEGGMAFTVPECFSRVDKSVWPNVGVGYFIKGHVIKETWALAVKAFNVEGASRERLLAERIPADGKVYAMMKLSNPVPVTFGDTEWFMVADGSRAFVNFYAWKPGRYVQVNVATDTPVIDEPWVKAFFESFRFKTK